MTKKEARVWAYDKAKETLEHQGVRPSPEEVMRSADKLMDWLLSEEGDPASTLR